MIGHCIGEGRRGRRPPRLSRSDHARLQPATAGATTSTKRASRFWCTRSARPKCAARSRSNSPRSRRTAALELPREEIERIRRLFRAAGVRNAAGRERTARKAEGGEQGVRGVGRYQRRAAQGAGLCDRDDLAQADRRRAGRCHRPSRWTSSPISPSDFSFDEIRVSHEQNLVLPHVRKRDLLAFGRRSTRPDLATANAGLITDIIACPGSIIAISPMRARSRSRRRSRKRFADLERQQHDRRAQDQDFRLHQRLRPSPCRPYRHSRRR